MQRDSIKKRLEVLEARQPPEEVESRDIEVSEEAKETYKKYYLACQEATETEEEFNKLFIGCAGNALARVSSQKIDLEVMEEMVKCLKEKGIVV